MPGHVGQNDADFTLLREELNAPIFRPLRPNFAIGPPFLTNFGGPQPLNSRGRGEREVGSIYLIDVFWPAHAEKG